MRIIGLILLFLCLFVFAGMSGSLRSSGVGRMCGAFLSDPAVDPFLPAVGAGVAVALEPYCVFWYEALFFPA